MISGINVSKAVVNKKALRFCSFAAMQPGQASESDGTASNKLININRIRILVHLQVD